MIDNCSWIITEKNGQKKVFSSDRELDNYIADTIKKGKVTFNGGTVYLASLNSREQVEAIIENIKEDISKSAIETVRYGDDPEESEIYYRIPRSIGVTRFLQQYGLDDGDFIVTPFDDITWRKKKIEEYINSGMTQEQAEGLVEKEMSSWPKMSQMGEDIHSIFEWVLSGENGEMPKMKQVNEQVKNEALNQIRDFKRYLLNKYGQNAKFYTELAIKSDDLDPTIKAKLEADGYDSINGKIDLLVIDDSNNAHLFDFKVSRKKINNEIWNSKLSNKERAEFEAEMDAQNGKNISEHWWHSTKKEAASHQLAMYAAMLKQKGIKVVDANIVPVHTFLTYADPETQLEVNGISGLTVQFGKDEAGNERMISRVAQVLGGKYATSASKVIRNPFNLTGNIATTLQNIYNAFFPKNTTVTDREHSMASVEELKSNEKIVQRLKPTHPKVKKGYVWRINKRGVGGVDYAKDDDDPNAKDEEKLSAKLQKYIISRSTKQSDENTDLANEIAAVMSGDAEIDDFAQKLPLQTRDFIKLQFTRYFKNEWNFEQDEILNQLGFFIFTKDNKVEIVTVTGGASLTTKVNLGPNRRDTRYTILGRTKKDRVVNKREILSSTIGNMELMRAMTYVALNKDKFDGKQIVEMRVINTVTTEEQQVANSKLVNNYNKLCNENITSGAPTVSNGLFMNDVEAYVDGAKERLLATGENLGGYFDSNTMQYTSEWLKNVISQMQADDRYSSKLHDIDDYDKNDPVWHAYVYLNKAYEASKGYFFEMEKSPGNWFTSSVLHFDGLHLASMQFSQSTTIRTLGEIVNKFANTIRKQVYDLGYPMIPLFDEVHKQFGHNPAIYKALFETDSQNNIREDLHLKDPDDPEIASNPAMKNLLDTFLKTMAKLRWGENVSEAEIEKYKETGEYYELPLMEARGIDQLKAFGLQTTLKNKIAQYQELTEGIFAGQDIDVEQVAKYDKVLYNRMAMTGMARQTFINNQGGVGFFEYDLETVFNNALVAYTKANTSKEYLPLVFALKLSLSHAEGYGGNRFAEKDTVSGITQTFNDLVKSKVYGKSILDEKQQEVMKVVSLVKKAFTTMTLAINVRSFLRESLQGIWTGISRAGFQILPGLNEKYYVEGLTHVIQESYKNFSGVSKLQQLNQLYAMANQSLSQVARNRKLDWANIHNWGKDTLFLTCTAPDFMHRVSILVGKMMADGSWEAHTLGKDGKLTYNWTKDKRFEIYAAGKTDDANYLKQKSLYLTMIDEFNKEGVRNPDGSMLKEGDALPQAYTSKEAQSVKNYADLLYGHYDDESRSLICDSLFGAFFLQYKTFLTAKLEQWTMTEGVYNTETIRQQFDVNGDELYEIIRYRNKDENGNPVGRPYRDIISKREYEALDENEKPHARLYYDYEGIPMEGMLNETLNMVNYIKNADWQQLEDIWKDPYRRGYFLLSLHDMWVAMFMSWLIAVLFGNMYDIEPIKGKSYVNTVASKMRAQDPYGQLTYNVLAGSFVDSQLPNIVQSFTDKPPVAVALERFATSTWALMCGNSSVAHWATRNIGAIKDFQGITKRALEK